MALWVYYYIVGLLFSHIGLTHYNSVLLRIRQAVEIDERDIQYQLAMSLTFIEKVFISASNMANIVVAILIALFEVVILTDIFHRKPRTKKINKFFLISITYIIGGLISIPLSIFVFIYGLIFRIPYKWYGK